jgi:hypothetical protein
MNKEYQLAQLSRMLTDSSLKSGFYLVDTDLEDGDIERYVKGVEGLSYFRSSLMPTNDCSGFEWFVIKLSWEFETNEIKDLRNYFLSEPTQRKDTILLSLLALIMRELSSERKTIIHVCGKFDLTSLTRNEVYKLNEAINESSYPIIIVNKKRTLDPLITTVSLKEIKRIDRKMDRTEVLHISYKHDTKYEVALKSVLTGLEKNNIPYSIDEYDIMYRDNIDDYEKEIGASNIVIMFVVPSYLKSLDCMFEMTQMFKKGNVRERIYPVVDMGGISRNGDGLKQIKDFWQQEKVRKLEQIKTEPGGSSFVMQELEKIDDIIIMLNAFWSFICRDSTGKYEKLIENDAALLIEELNKTWPKESGLIDENFVPSDDTKPAGFRTVVQNGEKSVYIENNTGTININ